MNGERRALVEEARAALRGPVGLAVGVESEGLAGRLNYGYLLLNLQLV